MLEGDTNGACLLRIAVNIHQGSDNHLSHVFIIKMKQIGLIINVIFLTLYREWSIVVLLLETIIIYGKFAIHFGFLPNPFALCSN